ncbi:related to PER1 protein, involved in manganese homeostasis [Cephalotrichum gorgonifer]|uniref:Post-GPI attachment to proteins factor 3 n=1 Tax=Cephalotrichum gorgonifer TaxID=2041049 RepID=A0AAE8MR67_9PEZI|nr:related to PER1 protein, involved in manganese homeostasis [Cephalotrichum gorgonifer]
MTSSKTGWARRSPFILTLAVAIILFAAMTEASAGDRLYAFRDCVKACEEDHCAQGQTPMAIPLYRRLLLWDCPAECDYACQQTTTAERVSAGYPVVQFHGKWPFTRILGIQEPFSVLFSLGNLYSHARGLRELRAAVPSSYPLLKFYKLFSYLAITSWVFSSVFHTRDFGLTEGLDYFGAGAAVMYGFYYAPVRALRLDRPDRKTRARLRAWTVLCASMYAAHVVYLLFVRWSYTYNMMANVVAGLIHNATWCLFSLRRYSEKGEAWTLLPILCAAWISAAMSLELLDFPPIWGGLDAHSLWHMFTVIPAYIWYR